MKEYLGAGGPVVNSLNVNRGNTTLAININLSSYIENIKNKTLKALQTFHTFSKECVTYITNRTKNYWQSVMPQKKRNTAHKVPCVKNIYNRKIRLLTVCHASNSKFYLTPIWSSERIPSQFFKNWRKLFHSIKQFFRFFIKALV